MEHIEEKLKKVIEWIGEPRNANFEGDKPIFYITFPVQQIMEVKRHFSDFVKVFEHHNFKTHVVSLAEIVNNFFINHPNRKTWFEYAEFDTKDELYQLFEDLATTLKNYEVVEKHLINKLSQIGENTENVLLITDIEALHPFTRFGSIENILYPKIHIPMVVFYPGSISGSALQFLNIYPEDGNYRSKHL